MLWAAVGWAMDFWNDEGAISLVILAMAILFFLIPLVMP